MSNAVAPWQEAISGAVAGVASRFVIAPFDVIKIRLQLQLLPTSLAAIPLRSAQNIPSERIYSGMIQAGYRIFREEGIMALWKGNVSATYLYFTYGGVQFYSYARIRQMLEAISIRLTGNLPQPDITSFVAGATAGLFGTVMTYPLDLIRTRFAMQTAEKVYESFPRAVSHIYTHEGLQGFYRGILPAVYQIGPYMGISFSTQAYINRHLQVLNDKPNGIPMRLSPEFVSGGLAGAISKTVVMPFDAIRKRLQMQGPDQQRFFATGKVPRTFVGCAAHVVRYEGFGAFWRGWVPSMLKSAPGTAVTFWVVAKMRELFANA
ncbi:mitochondrial carrier domain-containing protein [Cladochytrium replicatum]|nr:mitochondrial carrier domain-containing protein [Cladochytrium replicatum]